MVIYSNTFDLVSSASLSMKCSAEAMEKRVLLLTSAVDPWETKRQRQGNVLAGRIWQREKHTRFAIFLF